MPSACEISTIFKQDSETPVTEGICISKLLSSWMRQVKWPNCHQGPKTPVAEEVWISIPLFWCLQRVKWAKCFSRVWGNLLLKELASAYYCHHVASKQQVKKKFVGQVKWANCSSKVLGIFRRISTWKLSEGCFGMRPLLSKSCFGIHPLREGNLARWIDPPP